MASVTRPIPAFLNGVSQQPPSLRRSSQCEASVNTWPTLADGLGKRPPLHHLAKLSSTQYTSAHVHTINWSSTLQFIVVLIDDDLFVYDFAGNAKTVNFPDGKTYLSVTNALTDFAVVTVEDVTYVVNKTIATAMGSTTATGTAKGKKQTFAQLPASPTGGDVYEIVGDDKAGYKGYFVKWDAANSVWAECPEVGVVVDINAATMPHKLTYNAGTGQFTFQKDTWANRPVGNTTSVPVPSFIGRHINDVIFYRNRLGFLAGEYVCLSRSGPEYENFWPTTASNVLANDRIDLRASGVSVNTLLFGVPYNQQLLLFSDEVQFVLGTGQGQVLSPSTVSMSQSTAYAANAVAKPVNIGDVVFFSSQNDLFVALREYYTSGASDISNTAEEVTAHTQKFIPASVFSQIAAPDDDALFLLTSSFRNRIYPYKFYWIEDTKVQSAWQYWQVDIGTTILGGASINSVLYLVTSRADGTFLEAIYLQDDPSETDLGFVCHLDHLVALMGSYDDEDDETTWTLPYKHSGLDIQGVFSGDWSGRAGAIVQGLVQVDDATDTEVTVPGDLSTDYVWFGVPYTKLHRLDRLYLKKSLENADDDTPLEGILKLRYMTLRYSNSGYFEVQVTPRDGSDTYVYKMTAKTLGALDLIIGEPALETGEFKFPIVADSRDVTIDIVNSSHMPSFLTGAEWSATFTNRGG